VVKNLLTVQVMATEEANSFACGVAANSSLKVLQSRVKTG